MPVKLSETNTQHFSELSFIFFTLELKLPETSYTCETTTTRLCGVFANVATPQTPSSTGEQDWVVFSGSGICYNRSPNNRNQGNKSCGLPELLPEILPAQQCHPREWHSSWHGHTNKTSHHKLHQKKLKTGVISPQRKENGESDEYWWVSNVRSISISYQLEIHIMSSPIKQKKSKKQHKNPIYMVIIVTPSCPFPFLPLQCGLWNGISWCPRVRKALSINLFKLVTRKTEVWVPAHLCWRWQVQCRAAARHGLGSFCLSHWGFHLKCL